MGEPLILADPAFHDLSDASTEAAAQLLAQRLVTAQSGPDYAKSLHLAWMADYDGRTDEGYPMFSWDDLDYVERKAALLWRIDWIAAAEGAQPIDDDLRDGAIVTIKNAVTMPEHLALRHSIAATRAAMGVTWQRQQKKASPNGLVPARAGHLMAEGSAKTVLDNHLLGYTKKIERKVSFSEPVNRGTMLHGDNLAKGGDMLTSVTITDTRECQITTGLGNPIKTVYEAKAIST